MKQYLHRHGAFTFIEMLLVVIMIAAMSLFAFPKIKEIQKRQNAQQSGQNLKILNTSIVQWGIDNFGPPSPDGTNQATSEQVTLLPPDGTGPLCQAINVYVQTGFQWTSPSRPYEPAYVYQTWLDPNLNILRGGVFSLLDANSNYEPAGFENSKIIVNSFEVKACYANGYEDSGTWTPGTPRTYYSADTSTPPSLEDYP